MSTRGVIARKTDAGFEGRYHHWDSYPSGLGQTLFTLYRGHFDRDLNRMLSVLIDEHTCWSSIIGSDFQKPPGFGRGNQPQCYCHGDRDEDGWVCTHENSAASGCEYAYVFNNSTMLLLSSYNPDGRKMVGFFGSGNPDAQWHLLAEVDLDGEEPDWESIEEI